MSCGAPGSPSFRLARLALRLPKNTSRRPSFLTSAASTSGCRPTSAKLACSPPPTPSSATPRRQLRPKICRVSLHCTAAITAMGTASSSCLSRDVVPSRAKPGSLRRRSVQRVATHRSRTCPTVPSAPPTRAHFSPGVTCAGPAPRLRMNSPASVAPIHAGTCLMPMRLLNSPCQDGRVRPTCSPNAPSRPRLGTSNS